MIILGGVVYIVEGRIVCQNVLRKLGGKKSLESLFCGWLQNIKIHLRDVGCETSDWIHVAVDLCQLEAV